MAVGGQATPRGVAPGGTRTGQRGGGTMPRKRPEEYVDRIALVAALLLAGVVALGYANAVSGVGHAPSRAHWAMAQRWFLITYYGSINVFAALAFMADKRRACLGLYRYSEATLLGLSLWGGCVGAVTGMLAVRHKTTRAAFYVVPLFAFVLHAYANVHNMLPPQWRLLR